MSWDHREHQYQRNLCEHGIPDSGIYSPPLHLPIPPQLLQDADQDEASSLPPSPHPDLTQAGPSAPATQQPALPPHLQAPVPPQSVPAVGPQAHPYKALAIAATQSTQSTQLTQSTIPTTRPEPASVGRPPVSSAPLGDAQVSLNVTSDVDANKFIDDVCTAMNVRRDEDAQQAIEAMAGFVRRSRSLEPVLRIINMTPPPPAAPAAPRNRATTAASPNPDADAAALASQTLCHLRQLKDKYSCETHRGPHRWCFVGKSDGQRTGKRDSTILCRRKGYLAHQIAHALLWRVSSSRAIDIRGSMSFLLSLMLQQVTKTST